MKKISIFLITVLIVCGLITTVNADTEGTLTLTVEPSENIYVGDEFTVTLTPSTPLGAIDLIVNYTSDTLSYVSSSLSSDYINDVGGKIKISTFNTSGIENITLTFETLKSGVGNVSTDVNDNFSSLAVDIGNSFIAENDSIDVTIIDRPVVVDVSSITLNKTKDILLEGEKITLTATILPDNATDKTVLWTSSNTEVATVADGIVTALKEGTAIITATSGNKSATFELTVIKEEVNDNEVEVSSITIDKKNASLKVGEKITLNATVLPDNASDKTITWTSSDTKIATVSNGVVTALKEGTVIITAKSGDKTVTSTLTITSSTTNNSGDNTTAKDPLPQTGETFTIFFVIAFAFILGTIAVIQYRKNDDI